MEEHPGMLGTAQKSVHRICAAIMQQSSLRENSYAANSSYAELLILIWRKMI